MIKKIAAPIYTILLIALILIQLEHSSSAETNYTALQNKCQGSTSSGCCIASVRAMRDGNFQQAVGGKCPEGFKSTMFRCPGSLSWCEPKDDADIAVNGGSVGNYKKEAGDLKSSREKISAEENKASPETVK